MRNFRWMPGMACQWSHNRCPGGQQHIPTTARVADLPMGPMPVTFGVVDTSSVYHGATPDLTDPATLGCMLALVRDAWGDPGISIQGRYTNGRWFWLVNGGHYHGATFRRLAGTAHDSEADALVAALEAAP